MSIQIQEQLGLSSNEWNVLKDYLTLKTIKKKRTILLEGEVCKSILFVNKGAFRSFYLSKGKEYISQFFFEGDYACNFQSFFSEEGSRLYLDALEDSEVYVLTKQDYDRMSIDYPQFAQLNKALITSLSQVFSNRMETLLVENAKERYLNLLKRCSQIMLRVPQYMIASYLGITPETLSRIRKQVFLEMTSK